MGLVKLIPKSSGMPPYGLSMDRITSRGAVIGRDPGCDVVIKSDAVSKRHARLSVNAGSLMIEDLGSGNGTFIGSERITSAVVNSGDTIKLGNVAFSVEIRKSGTAEPAASPPVGRAAPNGQGAEPGRVWRLTGKDAGNNTVDLVFQPASDPSGKPMPTEWTVGRSREKADKVVPDQSVSGLHARIRFVPGRGLEISDAASANGTKVDGHKVGSGFVPVKAAQVVQLGAVKLRVSTS